MALEAYRKKRDFRKTPEPKGAPARKAARGPLSFAVQKHAASHLHYDLRLELGGVLKSWAVPKGPSLDPSVKRLAMHVEDHPLEYGSFEGVIPKGEYGGGTVVLWDRGRWLPEGDPKSAYRKGKLEFELEGEKLHGRWILVRRSRAAEEDGGKESWLLIKGEDAFARPGSGDAVVRERPGSVASGRTVEQIAASPGRVWHSREEHGGAAAAPALDPAGAKGSRRASLPARVEPELATLVREAPAGDEWLHEIKFDGYRVLTRVSEGKARLITRGGKDWTARFSSLAREMEKLPVKSALFDGEVVMLQPDGTTSFQALQEALGSGKHGELVYYLFDLLYLDGYDLRGVALEQRKRMLEALLPFSAAGPVRASEHVVGRGDAFYAEACRLGLEGILCKRRDSRYRSGRGREWVKVKCQLEQEFVIGGFTDPAGSRIGFGALLLGVYDAGRLAYVGKVGTGFNNEVLRTLRHRLDGLERKEPAFADPPRERGVHWVKPSLVGEVAFTEWTRDGAIRHPTFRGLREDKAPTSVRRERPSSSSSTGSGARPSTSTGASTTRSTSTSTRRSSRAGGRTSKRRSTRRTERTSTSTSTRKATTTSRSTGGMSASRSARATRARAGVSGMERARAWAQGKAPPRRRAPRPKGPRETTVAGVRMTHPQRVLFPGQGLTKLDLAHYYEQVADLMVPLIARRPLMLVRCPEGMEQQCFFQKHVRDEIPARVGRVEVEEREQKTGTYMFVTDLGGILTLLNLGALELHTWGARADRLERPDRIIFDLDPDPAVGWPAVVELALSVRDGLAKVGLKSFVRTTGGKGLHVVAPIGRRSTWEEVVGFARAFAEGIATHDPRRYTTNASKAKRKGRIYIDYLRNGRGATAVEAYSTRAREGAPVSTPVRWDELDDIRPDQFTAVNFGERLRSLRRDPWKDYGSVKQALTAKIIEAVKPE